LSAMIPNRFPPSTKCGCRRKGMTRFL